jgi:hypothetical protein
VSQEHGAALERDAAEQRQLVSRQNRGLICRRAAIWDFREDQLVAAVGAIKRCAPLSPRNTPDPLLERGFRGEFGIWFEGPAKDRCPCASDYLRDHIIEIGLGYAKASQPAPDRGRLTEQIVGLRLAHDAPRTAPHVGHWPAASMLGCKSPSTDMPVADAKRITISAVMRLRPRAACSTASDPIPMASARQRQVANDGRAFLIAARIQRDCAGVKT